MFGDTDKFVAEKVKAAVEAGLGVIACVGESLEEREGNKTKEVVERQLNAIAGDIPESAWKLVYLLLYMLSCADEKGRRHCLRTRLGYWYRQSRICRTSSGSSRRYPKLAIQDCFPVCRRRYQDHLRWFRQRKELCRAWYVVLLGAMLTK